jgi:hypothetical protein
VQVAVAVVLHRTLVEQYAHSILLQPEDLEMALWVTCTRMSRIA